MKGEKWAVAAKESFDTVIKAWLMFLHIDVRKRKVVWDFFRRKVQKQITKIAKSSACLVEISTGKQGAPNSWEIFQQQMVEGLGCLRVVKE